MKPGTRQSRPAFTLLELAVTTVVIGVLAVSAVPAFSTLADSRERAAAAELRRMLLTARSTALAGGRPTGVRLTADSTVSLVQIATAGAAPGALSGPGGTAEPERSLPGLFGGAAASSAQLGSGDSGAVTFWFGFDGTPQTRSTSGTLQSAWTGDGTVAFPRGTVVTVRRITGLIE